MSERLSAIAGHPRRLLGLILLLSLLLKLLLLWSDPVVNRDAAVYVAAARHYAQGQFDAGLAQYPMPLYPLLLAAVHGLVPDWIRAGQLLSSLALVLCLLPLYSLGCRLFSPAAALATCLLFALLPTYNEAAVFLLRDPLFLLLALACLAQLAHYSARPGIGGVFVTLLLALLATALRIEGLLLLALLPPLLLLITAANPAPGWRLKQVLRAGLLLVLLLALFWELGWLELAGVSRLGEARQWLEGLVRLELFADYRQLLDQIKQLQRQLPGGHLANNLLEVTRHYAPLIYLLGLVEMLATALLPGTLLALWPLWRAGRGFWSPARQVLLWPLLAFVALNLLFCLVHNFTTGRYLWLPLVLCLVLAGEGLQGWRQWLASRPALLALLLVLVYGVPAAKTLALAQQADKNHSIRQAGYWLRHNDAPQRLRLLSNDSRFGLYADRLALPWDRELAERLSSAETLPAVDLVLLALPARQRLVLPAGLVERATFHDGTMQVLVLAPGD
ncbi:hypothetical protein [Desulfuromonas thiophila]|uniref:hypothetical protein n=1 Tax=Desulfuromonas thiophila TaxID=57664 RepID=UPI0029F5334C|nr:hypothetical protein [Desulfuromonas thiophila]